MLSQQSTPCQRSAACGRVCIDCENVPETLSIRPATFADVNTIGPLRQLSARVLTGGHYAEVDLERALAAGPLDIDMIGAGSFFVGTLGERVIGTAAWSPSTDTHGTAVVRSVYVHPDAAGTGVGKKLMDIVERSAIEAGFARFELQSSLSAVGFYRRLGYHQIEQRGCTLNNGVELPVVQMHKRID